MADGGKREEGMSKEKRACSLVLRPTSVLGVAMSCDVSAEKKVRRIGKKMRQKRTIRSRGGRMFLVNVDDRFWGENAWSDRLLQGRYGID